jgi:hypothetical protein
MSKQNSLLPEDLKRWHRAYDVLTTLVNRSRQLPEQLLVQQVTFKTDVSIARGSYGDVFRGVHGRDIHKRETVAVKRLNVGKDDQETSQVSCSELSCLFLCRTEELSALLA